MSPLITLSKSVLETNKKHVALQHLIVSSMLANLVLSIISICLVAVAGLINKKENWHKNSRSKHVRSLPETMIFIMLIVSLFSVIYNYVENEKKQKKQLINSENSLKNTINLIEMHYDPVEYDLTKKTIDSITKVQRMSTTVFDISKLLSREINNPILDKNPVLNNYWQSLDEELRSINWPLSGYAAQPVEDMRSHLAKSLRQFINNLQVYYSDHNNSYK